MIANNCLQRTVKMLRILPSAEALRWALQAVAYTISASEAIHVCT